MNEARLCFSLGILKHFINDSLALNPEEHKLTGFDLINTILDAVAHNTYFETVGNKADTIYLRIKDTITEMTTFSYLGYI